MGCDSACGMRCERVAAAQMILGTREIHTKPSTKLGQAPKFLQLASGSFWQHPGTPPDKLLKPPRIQRICETMVLGSLQTTIQGLGLRFEKSGEGGANMKANPKNTPLRHGLFPKGSGGLACPQTVAPTHALRGSR